MVRQQISFISNSQNALNQQLDISSSTGNETQYIFENVYDVQLESDLNDVVSTMSFTLGNSTQMSSILKNLKALDYFEYRVKRNEADDWIIKFRGYINTISKTVSREDRKYNFTAFDKIGALNYITLTMANSINSLKDFVDAMKIQIEEVMPGLFTNFILETGTTENGSNIIFRNVEPDRNPMKYLQNIRDNCMLYVYYNPIKDAIIFKTPSRFLSKTGLPVWTFTTDYNIFGSLDYGDLSSYYNAVKYNGLGFAQGWAIDFFDYSETGTLRVFNVWDFSSSSQEELEVKAREKLLEFAKKSKINFQTKLDSTSIKIMVGEMMTIDDTGVGGELNRKSFVIEKLTTTISNEDYSLTISGYHSSLLDFPEKLVTSQYGVTDVDTLSVNADSNNVGSDVTW